MNKKILSLVLALVMVLGTFTSVFATETKKEEEVKKVVGKDQKIQYIIDNKFVEGYGDGDYGYDKNIKRSEITKLLVFANGNKALSEKLQGSMKLYSDVETSFWANGVISVGTTVPSTANKLAMLNGYPDGTFKPENDVTYAELAKMLVVLVKTDLTADMLKEANAKWATLWMTWAAKLGILDDVTVANSDAPATRADAFVMMYNALYAMKYIKKMPANETMGILSQLKNTELTLNQGEKAKTFKITPNTTFVLYSNEDGLDANAANAGYKTNRWAKAVKVASIANPNYYYGSLVRVLADDKGEVTHILQLGNPKYLALGNNEATPHKQDLVKGQWEPSFPNNAAEELGKILKAIADTATTKGIKWEVFENQVALDEYTNELIKKWSYTGQGWWRVDPNTRWVDVADATAETKVMDFTPVQSFFKGLDLPKIMEQIGIAYPQVVNDANVDTFKRVENIINTVYTKKLSHLINSVLERDVWDNFITEVNQEIMKTEIPNKAQLAISITKVLNSVGFNLRMPNTFGILAKIDYSKGTPKEIGFWGGAFTKPTVNEGKKADPNNYQAWDYINIDGWMPAQELLAARLTNNTKYFVADVANNQLTELSSIDEAVRLLGNVRAANWFSDVYVGYNVTDKDAARENTQVSGFAEATVVVFNSVQKSNNNGTLYRVRNEATTKYEASLEKTNGEREIINIGNTRFNAPFNFNDAKFDVVKYYNNNAYGQRFDTLIDHSNTTIFPIVKVTAVNGNKIIVEDKYGSTARMTLDTNHDQFLESEKLMDAVIQFRTASGNVKGKYDNVIEIVSVLGRANDPNGVALKGTLQNTVNANQKNVRAGVPVLVDFDVANGWANVRFDRLRDLYDANQNVDTLIYRVTITEANALQRYMNDNPGKEVNFRVEKDVDSRERAFDIKWDTTKPIVDYVTPLTKEEIVENNILKSFRDNHLALYKNTGSATALTAAQKAVNEIENAKAQLTAQKELNVVKDLFKAYIDALGAIPVADPRVATVEQYEALINAWNKLPAGEYKNNARKVVDAIKTI